LFSTVCLADESDWTLDKIPTDNIDKFLFYYKNFIHVNPFIINSQPQNENELKDNLKKHRNAAEFYSQLSIAANNFARNKSLPAFSNVKKEQKNHVKNTWNLYINIPPNARDLWEESCFLKYKSLEHEAAIDSNKIKILHIFVTEIEQYDELKSLFQSLKRNACLKSLEYSHHAIVKCKNNNSQKLPNLDEHAKNLEIIAETLAEFWVKYPTAENLKIGETFLEIINLFREFDTNLKSYNKIIEPTKKCFAKIKKFDNNQKNINIAKAYAELYEGMIRRIELVGKQTPIWGADIYGKILDENALKDKVVLLDFWATWCVPCVAEFPHLKKIYKKYKNNGLEIVCYSIDTDKNKLLDFVKRNDLNWIVLSKEETEKANLTPLSVYYGVRKIPVAILRDKNGNAILLDATGDKLDAALEKIFDQK
jgi:thiol-disulfide isomerase/thioredoxin